MSKGVYEIDGRNFSTLDEFFAEIDRVLVPGAKWGHNLNAFNDILRGGFGTPEGGFVLRWKNSSVSRERLGYQETVRELKRARLRNLFNWKMFAKGLQEARSNSGATVFDWVVDIIRLHGPGGEESEDGVELVLE